MDLMPDTRYQLSMSRNYVSSWTVLEAIREWIQNARDSDSPFEYSFEDDRFTITSRYDTLDARTLILGSTTKADQADKVGQFGEGYKLALLVLTREDKEPCVYNGDKLWTPVFEHSEQFGAELLTIVEQDNPYPSCGICFSASNLTDEEQAGIRELCLMMQPPMRDVIGTETCSILPSRPGKLYVGGLFVCDTKLTYGYDFLPEYLSLERDRQTVSDVHLKFQVKDAWFTVEDQEFVASLIELGIPDMEYANYATPEPLAELLFSRFTAKYPDGIAVKSQAEADTLKSQGHAHRGVYMSSGYHGALSGSSGYRASVAPIAKAKKPAEILDDWFKANRKNLSRAGRESFRALIKKADNWEPKGSYF
jgi:hypothetical protein